jgi:hypothetical protein
MTISEQTYAVLAMDSYNRGFASAEDATKTQWLTTQGIQPFWTSEEMSIENTGLEDVVSLTETGFYAAAYLVNGEVVISYRGTDDAYDMPYGWPIVPGGIPATDLGVQSQLAIMAYREVAAQSEAQGKTISTTGHSLGGALPGFVASIYGLRGCLVAETGPCSSQG